jgi:hypothetical protein
MDRGEEGSDGVCEDSEIVVRETELVGGVCGRGGIDVVGERASRESWPSTMLDFRACGWSEESASVSVRDRGAGMRGDKGAGEKIVEADDAYQSRY